MSEKHEMYARRLFDDVWGKGRIEAIDELVTGDVVGHDPMNPVKGIGEFRNVVMKYRTAFPDLRLDIEDLFSAGDKVVIRWRATGTNRGQLEGLAPTGRQATVTGISITRFAGDRICELFDSWDALGLMQQLGAVTLPGKTAAAARK